MLAAAIIVAGIAIVDSLNPATIAPALVFAVGADATRRMLEFAAGFFLVNVAGGILLVLGPGHWLLGLIPDLSDHTKHRLEVAAGAALLVAAVGLLLARRRLTRPKERSGTDADTRRRSGPAFVVGAGIALVELPTALPYFAALAAIVAADVSLPAEILLVVLFNVLFLAPVVAIAIALALIPSLEEKVIEPVRRWFAVHWPEVLAAVLAAAGVALVVVGG